MTFFLRSTQRGLVVGGLLAFGFAVHGTLTVWWDVVATLLVGGFLFGAATAWPVQRLAALIARTRPHRALLYTSSVLLSLAVGVALLSLMADAPHGIWRRVPAPPRVPIAFVGPTCYELWGERPQVQVTAEDSTLWAYPVGGRGPEQWTRLPHPSVASSQALVNCNGRAPSHATPWTFGRVTARTAIASAGVDCGAAAYYLLKADHSLWLWDTGVRCSLGTVGEVLIFLGATFVLGVRTARRALGP